MYDFCGYCGKENPSSQRIDSKFCSEKCKIDHHNDARKAARAQKRALEAINQLVKIMESGGDKAQSAYAALQNIQRQSSLSTKSVTWVCDNCGQSQFDIPTTGTKCHFCKKSKFSIRKG
jgi:rubrerythrin